MKTVKVTFPDGSVRDCPASERLSGRRGDSSRSSSVLPRTNPHSGVALQRSDWRMGGKPASLADGISVVYAFDPLRTLSRSNEPRFSLPPGLSAEPIGRPARVHSRAGISAKDTPWRPCRGPWRTTEPYIPDQTETY